ncbi:hypothetical protein [Fluviicola taffensis]|uniref:YD repeat protein n=1 Tax=Fluviicola taffensis (strain DSM 16823 / NCIMB 13979 / RW262) TaxID=755732 RepID=F2IC14_FLUTR|nr:hypothetical protein [Fluviicola taffensis]AEA43240.1 hypothetical protein Fluta_1245 [Fluviicola taffensis DSM 16823]
MRNRLFFIIPFYLLVSCSADFMCGDEQETVIIRKNKVEKRIGYSYVPESDSLSDIESIEYFDQQGNLTLFQHYMSGAVVRQKKYEYDEHGRQLKVHDSISNSYRVFEYGNSCDALKSIQYSAKNEVLSYVEYSDSAGYKVYKQYSPNGDLLNYSLNKMDQHKNPLSFEGYLFDYEYDKKGNLLKQTRLYKGQTSTTIFERNNKGLIVKQQIIQNEEYLGGSYFRYEYY